VKNGTKAVVLAIAASLNLSACKSNGNEGGTIALAGAGSTFVYPVMSRWTDDFQRSHQNVQINYQSIGSGGGIQQVKAGTVDFGASDAALSDQQLAQMPPVVQIPESAGPVAVIYNLPELKSPLQLSPETLAGIFLGKIKSWQDPLVKRDNPGVALPKEPVAVVHRAESSGTSNIFTTYLADVSPEWKSKVGAGTQVSWPTGDGGKGSEGVTGQVRQAPGGIGYVDLTYAIQTKIPFASIKNQAGKYVQPSLGSTTAAINAYADQLAKDPRTPIVNAPATAAGAYPISGLTFLILPKDGPDKAKRQALKDFVKYVVTDGQAIAGQLNYAPLPEAVKQNDLRVLNQLTASGKALQ
jgi:phosphate transport system substrate-binding protein